MSKRFLLLTPSEQAADLMALIHRLAPSAGVAHAPDLATLVATLPHLGPGDRVIAFATPVIVPQAVLDALPGLAYNFHNGPPAYPGLYPAVFALYDGATGFGATAHVMTAEVDQGPIVGVEPVDMPDGIDRLHLEADVRAAMLRLFERLLPALLESDGPLPLADIPWGAPVRRRRDFETLCTLPADIVAAEFARRYRAVGEGPHHALRIPLHGRWFRLEGLPGDGTVLRGGVPSPD